MRYSRYVPGGGLEGDVEPPVLPRRQVGHEGDEGQLDDAYPPQEVPRDGPHGGQRGRHQQHDRETTQENAQRSPTRLGSRLGLVLGFVVGRSAGFQIQIMWRRGRVMDLEEDGTVRLVAYARGTYLAPSMSK